MEQDERFMRVALELAQRGVTPDPNPRVGCVLVGPGGDVVGQGWHRGSGTPHAEVAALADAQSAQGATAYVTLEPCHHVGRTGPCTGALLAAGVRRVVFAAGDPNPVAEGGGDFLSAAGVEVTRGVLADEARQLNPEWEFAVQHGRPFVTWKFAATLDGYSAAEDGTSQWITSEAARTDVQWWRHQCGAIIAGTGTVAADDPHLTARHPDGTLAERQPLRVVVGYTDLDPSLRAFDDAAETLQLFTRDPHEVMRVLRRRGIRHAWLEGGPTLAAAWWRAGLVDRVIAYIAPALLGSGRPATPGLGITTIHDIARLDTVDVTLIGGDVRLIALPKES